MSRIGKQPITVPSGVDVTIAGGARDREGPEGSTRARRSSVASPSHATATTLVVTRADDTRSNRSLHGLQRSLINNMVVGVSEGFVKELEIVGVGYRAAGAGLRRHRARARLLAPGARRRRPTGITFEVPQPTRIIVRGYDKQLVGQVAADIRKIRKPEPYKGKGVRYAGERIVRKAGKSAK